MKPGNLTLFIIPTLIWGSTWYAIKFQLGEVDPLLSIAYRFGIAGIIMFGYSFIAKKNLKFSSADHFYIFLQGICLFGFNYWLVYLAELNLTSGLLSVIFSSLIFLNIIFSSIFLKSKLNRLVLLSAFLGISGTVLIFRSEIKVLDFNDKNFIALLLSFISVICASAGNILSAYNQKRKLPVIQTNAFGMTYGAIAMFLIAIFSGKSFQFEFTPEYTISLFYLAIFGSVVAFSLYLKLLGNIGPDRAAYAVLVIPVIAMIVSTIFEDFKWDKFSFLGIAILMAGNILALRTKTKIKI